MYREYIMSCLLFRCNCQHASGSPCYTQFSADEILRCRLETAELTSGKY